MPDTSDLLGVPYAPHGRSLAGMDCYGFVIEWQRRLGRTIFDFGYKPKEYKKGSEYPVWEKSMEMWKETKSPKKDDVLLFFDGKGRVVHAANYIGGGRISHCDVQGSRVERLDGFYYRNWKAYEWRR